MATGRSSLPSPSTAMGAPWGGGQWLQEYGAAGGDLVGEDVEGARGGRSATTLRHYFSGRERECRATSASRASSAASLSFGNCWSCSRALSSTGSALSGSSMRRKSVAWRIWQRVKVHGIPTDSLTIEAGSLKPSDCRNSSLSKKYWARSLSSRADRNFRSCRSAICIAWLNEAYAASSSPASCMYDASATAMVICCSILPLLCAIDRARSNRFLIPAPGSVASPFSYQLWATPSKSPAVSKQLAATRKRPRSGTSGIDTIA